MTVGAWMGIAGFFFTQQPRMNGHRINLPGFMTPPARKRRPYFILLFARESPPGMFFSRKIGMTRRAIQRLMDRAPEFICLHICLKGFFIFEFFDYPALRVAL
jgi:hypothetical protein